MGARTVAAVLVASLCAYGAGYATSGRMASQSDSDDRANAESPPGNEYELWYWKRHPEHRYEQINREWGLPERALGTQWPSLEVAEQRASSRACVDGHVHDKHAGRWQVLRTPSKPGGPSDMVHTCTAVPVELLDAIREHNRHTYGHLFDDIGTASPG